MPAKTDFLQIRISPGDKKTLKRLASAAGLDVSTYVLARSLPRLEIRFQHILRALARDGDERFVLAQLNDFLAALAPMELAGAVGSADLTPLSPFQANYVTAMIEQASHAAGIAAPEWTAQVRPLDQPWFAAPLMSLRPHLLRAAPVPFKKRNLFPDAGVGDRI